MPGDKKVPVLVAIAPQQQERWELPYHRFLIGGDEPFGLMVYVLRRRLHLRPDEAIYAVITGTATSPCSTQLMGQLLAEHGVAGILHLTISGESTFGQ